MAILFVSGVQADRTFVMKIAQELADVVDGVQVGEHPLTTPPPPSLKPNQHYAAVVAVISPSYMPKVAALKSYCDEMGIALIPISRYEPTEPIPELGRHAIHFRDSRYTDAFLILLQELRDAKVRVYVQNRRSSDHWSPLDEVRVPQAHSRVVWVLLRGVVLVVLLVGARYGLIKAIDYNQQTTPPTATPFYFRPMTTTPSPTPTQIPDAAWEALRSDIES